MRSHFLFEIVIISSIFFVVLSNTEFDVIDCNDGYYKSLSKLCKICEPGFCCFNNNKYSSSEGYYISESGVGRPFKYTCKDDEGTIIYINECSCNRIATKCTAGYYCPNIEMVSGANEEYSCGTGFYCPEGSSTKNECLDGYYCNGSTQKICPGGYYCSTYNKENPTLNVLSCPIGKYCPEGSTSGTQCEDGYNCPGRASEQVICPEGYYCTKGVKYVCPEGYYCPEGSSSALECPYSHVCQEGSSEATLCECSGHGTCYIGDLKNCTCEEGYNLQADCGGFSCYGILEDEYDSCTSNGKCIGVDECECYNDYYGPNCTEFNCSCQNGGICESPGKCSCSILFQGDSCDEINPTLTLVFSISGGVVVIFLLLLCLFFVFMCFCFLKISKKAAIVDKIEDVDIILEEQKANRVSMVDEKTPKLATDNELFKIKTSDLKILEKIGEGGSSATIFRAEWNDMDVAFKCFQVMDYLDDEKFSEFEKEVKILSSVHYPYILNFYGASVEKRRIGYIMEYCSNGDLVSYIKKKKQKGEELEFQKRLKMLIQICSAMKYLHSIGIIHRDLKCENVLIDDSENCKVMDFGASKIAKNGGKTKTVMVGTSYYMAPEVLSGKYDKKCDVFSFAILMFIVLSNNFQPYGSTHTNHIELKVKNNEEFRPDFTEASIKVPEELKILIQQCWKGDPSKRPEFSSVLTSLKNFKK